MTNVYSDLLKINAKKQSKSDDLNESLKTQGTLAKMRYDIGAGVPTAADDDANMFSTMRQQLGGGSFPQRGWRGAMSAIFSGLELGAKSKGNDERREIARKMMDTFSSLEGIANEAGRRNEAYAKKAALQEQLTPELEALTRNMSVLSYDDVAKVGSNIVDRINKSSGTNYKISMIDQQNGRVLLTEAGKPDQKYDLLEMFPKIREEQNVEYLTKKAIQVQAEQDLLKARKLSATEKRNDLMEESLGARFEGLGIKSAKELLPRAVASADTKKLAGKIIKDAKANPQVFAGTMSAIMNTAGDAGAFKLWLDTTFNSDKDRDAAMRIAKNINQIKISDAKSLGGSNNQTIDQWIDAAYPSAQYSQENFLEIMKDIEEKAAYHEAIYRDTLSGRSAGHLGESFDRRTEEYNNPKSVPEQQLAEVEQTVPVVSPDGAIGKIPMSKLKEALNDGYTLQ